MTTLRLAARFKWTIGMVLFVSALTVALAIKSPWWSWTPAAWAAASIWQARSRARRRA